MAEEVEKVAITLVITNRKTITPDGLVSHNYVLICRLVSGEVLSDDERSA